MLRKDSRIYIAGHKGLLGSAIIRKLADKGYKNIIVKTHKELDLTEQEQVREFFRQEKPEYVFLAAAKVGGIGANSSYPVDFIVENTLIEFNVLQSAFNNNVKKLLFLGSSCMYPRACAQPIKEEYLLTGPLEPTNEAFALAKISGVKMCKYYNLQYGTKYIVAVPNSLYGPNDNYDLNNSHVLPALLRKIHEANNKGRRFVEIWGTGKPLREFLHVDDAADACVFLMENYEGNEFLNLGTGKEISIRELAEIIKRVVGFGGELVFNIGKPDGMQRKLLDVSKLEELGWKYKIELEDGIRSTYEAFCKESGLA